jgi:hypothetical protein
MMVNMIIKLSMATSKVNSAPTVFNQWSKTASPHSQNDDKVEFGPGVTAEYRLRRKERKSGPLDPYDITLIDPSRLD